MKIQSLIQNPTYKKKFVLEKILCHELSLSREELWTSDQDLTEAQLSKIISSYEKYAEQDRPLEYILGYVEFFQTKFFVNEHTLIPRPETEYMITAVTEYIQSQQKSDPYLLLDVGTGCGVLGISVLLQNPKAFREIFFSDISPEALTVAKKNYDVLISSADYDTRFIQSNLIAYLESYASLIANQDIILVANLPYIPEDTFTNNAPDNVQKWEPKLAFVGGDDGLIYYREMFTQLKEFKNLTGRNGQVIMFLEMMTWQVEILIKEFGDWISFEEVKTFHFNIRILQATLR